MDFRLLTHPIPLLSIKHFSVNYFVNKLKQIENKKLNLLRLIKRLWLYYTSILHVYNDCVLFFFFFFFFFKFNIMYTIFIVVICLLICLFAFSRFNISCYNIHCFVVQLNMLFRYKYKIVQIDAWLQIVL